MPKKSPKVDFLRELVIYIYRYINIYIYLFRSLTDEHCLQVEKSAGTKQILRERQHKQSNLLARKTTDLANNNKNNNCAKA